MSSGKNSWFLSALLLIGIALAAFLLFSPGDKKPPIESFSGLEKRMTEGKVKKLELDPASEAVRVTEKNEEIKPYTLGIPSGEATDQLIKDAKENGISISSKPIKTSGGIFSVFLRLLPTFFILLLILGIMGFQFGWFNKIAVEPAKADVAFLDVAGCDEAIEELEDVRSFLKNPKKFEKLGARVPKGVLLHGPPGTGKTLLAKAVANEADIPFFASSGSEFIEMFAGLGARRVRQLFEKAKKVAPSIIFIDELDAVGGHRTSGGGGDGASREADQTLIQILKEMDGFSVSEHPVIVMGATNRIEALDRALLRPGRFDRHISIDPPDKNGREAVLRVHAREKKLSSKVSLENLAAQTAGMTGADLELILNEAALIAARRGAKEIEEQDIDDAYFRVVAGVKKEKRVFSDSEREIIAYHESGHALVGEKLKGAEQVHKISIIPRGRSGGQTLYVSNEDLFLYSREELENRICAYLAGRAAEEEIFGRITSGAADDLQRVSEIVERMVCELGMSEKVGLRVLDKDSDISSDIANTAEQEIAKVIEEQYARARQILAEEKETLTLLAEALQKEETIDRDRFLQIIEKKND